MMKNYSFTRLTGARLRSLTAAAACALTLATVPTAQAASVFAGSSTAGDAASQASSTVGEGVAIGVGVVFNAVNILVNGGGHVDAVVLQDPMAVGSSAFRADAANHVVVTKKGQPSEIVKVSSSAVPTGAGESTAMRYILDKPVNVEQGDTVTVYYTGGAQGAGDISAKLEHFEDRNVVAENAAAQIQPRPITSN